MLVDVNPVMIASPNTSIFLSSSAHGYLHAIRGYLTVKRAALPTAMKSPARGEAIFRVNAFTGYKKVQPVHGGKVTEPGSYALEQLQFFSSGKVVLLFDLVRKVTPFCRSAQLADLTCFEDGHIPGSEDGRTRRLSVLEPSGRGEHAAGLARAQLSTVKMSMFFSRN